MDLTDDLEKRIQQDLGQKSWASLCAASIQLSKRYRDGIYDAPLTAQERYAYLLARMPATCATSIAVFSILKYHAPQFAPRSMLDIGAGPGSATLMARREFPSLEKLTLVEQDPEWIRLGRKYFDALNKDEWRQADFSTARFDTTADLVVAAYALQEIAKEKLPTLSASLWHASSDMLVLIEPGTTEGFARIRIVREALLKAGAHIVAPCPHQMPCPIESGDWCHFRTRFSRTEAHRRVKQGQMGYEDEKYAYLIVSKNPAEAFEARVIRQPIKRSGHILLDLCTNGEIKRRVVARSQKNAMRVARKLEWGSAVHTDELDS